MAGKYTSQKDLAELTLYRRLAEINGRLDALKAMEAIESDLLRRGSNRQHAGRAVEIDHGAFGIGQRDTGAIVPPAN